MRNYSHLSWFGPLLPFKLIWFLFPCETHSLLLELERWTMKWASCQLYQPFSHRDELSILINKFWGKCFEATVVGFCECVPERVPTGSDELNDFLVSKPLHGGFVHTCDGIPCTNTNIQTCMLASRASRSSQMRHTSEGNLNTCARQMWED